MTKTQARTQLLHALETMPDEAFGWLVGGCLPPPHGAAGGFGPMPRIWPDGLGGFLETSREAIVAVQTAAQAYWDAKD